MCPSGLHILPRTEICVYQTQSSSSSSLFFSSYCPYPLPAQPTAPRPPVNHTFPPLSTSWNIQRAWHGARCCPPSLSAGQAASWQGTWLIGGCGWGGGRDGVFKLSGWANRGNGLTVIHLLLLLLLSLIFRDIIIIIYYSAKGQSPGGVVFSVCGWVGWLVGWLICLQNNSDYATVRHW